MIAARKQAFDQLVYQRVSHISDSHRDEGQTNKVVMTDPVTIEEIGYF